MKNVLLSCPNMIKYIDNYKNIIEKNNINIIYPTIQQIISEEYLLENISKYDFWIVGDDEVSQKIIDKAINLKFIIKWGIGMDNIDLDYCYLKKIKVQNIPNVFGEEVSDIAVGMLLCLTRKLHIIHIGNMSNKWLKPTGINLVNKKICLIGFGNIGKCIVRKLLAFQMNIWVSDPAYKKINGKIKCNYGHGSKPGDISIVGLEKINIDILDNCLEDAEFIIICCALTENNKYLINRDNILKTKKGVKIINVSRGKLLNEKDTIELLKEKHIDCIGLDVFEEEPLTEFNELKKFQDNIFGSHNASNSIEALEKVNLKVLDLIINYST